MGTLKENIIHDRNMAMKMRDKQLTLFLNTLIGEMDRNKEKNPSDDSVIKLIKKIIEENTEHNINPEETKVLSQYLPSKLTDLELNTVITNQITTNGYSGMKDMGKIMNFLRDNYPSQYDGQIASNLVKTILTPANAI